MNFRENRRIISGVLALCLLLASPLLSACQGFGARTSPSAMPPSPPPQDEPAVLSIVDQLPVISHYPNSDAINQTLSDVFGLLLGKIKRYTNEYPDLALHYSLSQGEEALALKAYLMLEGQKIWELAELAIDKQGQMMSFPSEILDILSHEDFISRAFYLQRQNIAVDLHCYAKTITTRDICKILVEVYQQAQGSPVDADAVVAAVTDPLARKAFAMELEYYPSEDHQLVNYPGSMVTVLDYTTRMLNYAQKYQNDRASSVVTIADFVRMLTLYESMSAALFEEGGQSANGMGNLASQIPDAMLKQADTVLDRSLLAELFVGMYTKRVGEISTEKPAYIELDDTRSRLIYQAVNAGLMGQYPALSNTFSPDEPVRFYQLPDLLNAFIYSLYQQNKEVDLFQLIPYENLVMHAGVVLAYLLEETQPKYAAIETVNDQPWEWYTTQVDTGEYSDINCMPATLAMALKWYDQQLDQSVEQLRALYPKNNNPWYMELVENALTRYEVSYLSHYATLKNMQKDLSEGMVLFCMINDGDTAKTGHCVLVNGMIQKGNSLWFIVQDAGYALEPTDLYGKPYGKDRLIEANYLVFITARFNDTYLGILPPKETEQ